MLGEKIGHYNECGNSLRVTPAKYKTEFEFLKEVDSLALANAQLNLEAAYKNFFRDKSIGFPKFKSRKNDRKSYTTNCVGNNIRFEGKHIRLPKLGNVRVKQHRSIPKDYTLKSVTVSQSASGKYHVSVLFEYEANVRPKTIESVIGLDFSMPELYISSEGEKPNLVSSTSLTNSQDIIAVRWISLHVCSGHCLRCKNTATTTTNKNAELRSFTNT